MPNLVTVAGSVYQWSFVCNTSEFPKLCGIYTKYLDILRISSIDESFDVSIRVDSQNYSGGIIKFLGPVLVLAGEFPNRKEPLPLGRLLQLRPRLCRLKGDSPNATTVERVVQWCGSQHFRVVRINVNGGLWIGDETKYD